MICLSLIIVGVSAQQLYFSTLSVRDGLPSNIIAGIAQDKYGFLWIGTGNGLARYDGSKFTVFKRTTAENSLPYNELTGLAASRDYIWVGSWGGLCKVHVKTFQVSRVHLDGINMVRTIHKGQNQVLWIGTGKGLVRYNEKTGLYTIFNKNQNGLSHDMVRSIYEDQNGTVWVGTFDGLNFLKQGQDRFQQVSLPLSGKRKLQNHLILDIKPAIEDDPHLWIGTEQGLFRLNTQTMEAFAFDPEKAGFSNPVIKTVFQDGQGKLWLGTDFGLNIFDPVANLNNSNFHNPRLPYSIANNVVWQIFEDSNHIIWLVTSNGLSKVNKYGNIYTVHDISYESGGQVIGNQIKAFLTGSSGDYWLATQHGVIQIDQETEKKTFYNTQSPPSQRIVLDNVWSLHEDPIGKIWIGTAGGINVWDPVSGKMHLIRAESSNGLNSNYIGHFSQEPDGTLWVSAWQGGLFRIDGNLDHLDSIRFKKVPNLDSGSEKHVYGSGNIWTIEYDKLYKVNPESMAVQPVETFNDATAGKTIYTLYHSGNGHIWTGTLNALVQYDPWKDSVKIHPISTGNDEIVISITEDRSGNIWSVTSSSIQKLMPESGRLEIFPLDHNLPIKSFYFGCVARNQAGNIIFGGDNGFIEFSPSQVSTHLIAPPVYITDLEINNRPIQINEHLGGRELLRQSISFTDQLKLDYKERSFTLQFSSLDFWQPDQNLYAYRLEGFEDNWHQVSGTKNQAIYSNIPAGDYTFHVKSINNHGQGENTSRRLDITIYPPLLLRWYFITLYAILIALLIYYGLKTYLARVHLKNQLKITRLEMEHAEELEQTKENFFTNISHELRTPISLILPPLHQIQKQHKLDAESSKLIDLAEKNAVRLLKLVNQILDFNKITHNTSQLKVEETAITAFCKEVFGMFQDKANRHQIRYEFKSDAPFIKTWVDREKLETILFNLLSNAFKFTPDKGKILLHLTNIIGSADFKHGIFRISVSDSGIGIPEADQQHIFKRFYQTEAGKRNTSGSGIGLTLAAEFVELHQGKIRVKSRPGKGTVFTVDLPLDKSHLTADVAVPPVYSCQKGSDFHQPDLASDKPMVLIIDDNEDIIEFIRTSLGQKYNFVVAENGQEGLQKANQFLPQVVISDIMMPLMDGLTFCKKTKENPKTSHISIILLTAKSLTEHQVEGIRVGADAYLTKPFEIELLDSYIEQLIARKKELTHYFKNHLIQLSDEPDAANNEDNIFVKRVMDIIEANISNPELSVEMISREMAMSSTHLYRKLKAITDRSPKEIIQKYRLKKASLLLQNKEGNISEIVYQVGFSSLSYFSRCFKEEYGHTPKKYQEKFNTPVSSPLNE